MRPLRCSLCAFFLASFHVAAVQLPSRRGHRGGASGSCSCLPYAEAYRTYGVECGQTFETPRQLPATGEISVGKGSDELELYRHYYGEEFCDRFFKRNEHNYCVRTRFMASPEDNTRYANASWCYVSKTCTELNGGAPVEGTEASWKICQKEETRLSDMSVKSIIQLARYQDVDGGFLPAWAYPYVDEDPETYLADNGTRVLQLQKLGQPVFVWPKAAHLKPRLIVTPSQVWMQWPGSGSRPSTFWNTTCIMGDCKSAQ